MNLTWWLLVVINGQASVSDPLPLDQCYEAAQELKRLSSVEYADCFRIAVVPKEKEPPKRPKEEAGIEA